MGRKESSIILWFFKTLLYAAILSASVKWFGGHRMLAKSMAMTLIIVLSLREIDLDASISNSKYPVRIRH